MIYFQVATIIIAAAGLLVYTALFDRKFLFGLIVTEVILAGFLSFYIFYYIGSYNSVCSDITMNTSTVSLDRDLYTLELNIHWLKKPEIFGFDGNDDLLIVRYDTARTVIMSADRSYRESGAGETIIKLSKGYDDYKYMKTGSTKREIAFNVEDGKDARVRVAVKSLEKGSSVEIFYIHDYQRPLEAPVFWERDENVTLD